MNPVTVQEKLDRAKGLFDQARAILETKDAPAEERAKVQPLLEEAKALKAEAAQLKDIDEFGKEYLAAQEAKQGKDTEKQERQSKTKFAEWGEFLRAVWVAENPKFKNAPDPRLQWFKEEEK